MERKRRSSCKRKQRFSWVACQASKHPVALAAATLAALSIYVYASGETKKEKRDHYFDLALKYESRTGVLLNLLQARPDVLYTFSKRELTQTFLTYMMVKALVKEREIPMFDTAFADLQSFVSPQDMKKGILLELSKRVPDTLNRLVAAVVSIQNYISELLYDSPDVTRAVDALKNSVILAVLYKSRVEITHIDMEVFAFMEEHIRKPLHEKTTLIAQYLKGEQKSDDVFGVIPMPDIVAKNMSF